MTQPRARTHAGADAARPVGPTASEHGVEWSATGQPGVELSDDQYRVLFAFRCALRQYLRWSKSQAAGFGLAPQQSQLLLAIRVRPDHAPPSISELADALQICQHSAVGLANRAQHAGLVKRMVDPKDQRVVRIGLTERGRSLVADLASTHLAELQLVADRLHISDEFLQNLSEEFSALLLATEDIPGDSGDSPPSGLG